MAEEDTEAISRMEDDFVPGGAWPVCPKCFKPCNPLQNYCENCDSNEAINPLASYMPYEDIRFTAGMYGKVWRKMWDENTSILLKPIFLFILIMGAPILLVFGLPLYLTGKIKDVRVRKIATTAFYISLTALLFIFILERLTKCLCIQTAYFPACFVVGSKSSSK